MRFLRSLLPYAVIFFVVQILLRLSLLVRAYLDVRLTVEEIIQILLRGAWFDAGVVTYCLLPIALLHLLLPPRFVKDSIARGSDMVLRFLFAYSLLFGFVAEHLFWTEFTTRFNFIAVDYLIYTSEVIGNIRESYPLPSLLTAIGVTAAITAWISVHLTPSTLPVTAWRTRAAGLLLLAAAGTGFYFISDARQAQVGDNAEATEVASNGIYNLFHAFWNNEISYNQFYASEPESVVEANAKALLVKRNMNPTKLDASNLTRIVRNKGAEKHKNVIVVVMESMSAEYMGTFGNKQNLTPNLDRLGREGLLLSDAYATGTRTVRGLEAVTLSIPPTPGQSILRRPNNDNLFSLGFIFKDRGYDTRFIYGGYGYFDNMNGFFAGNGFDTVDRTQMTKDEVHFANVWGVSDEDLFAKVIKESDASYAKKKPFMHVVMTTSNHRPYTYPDGKIDIPSKVGRLGGVKYADYSVGRLIEAAQKKPWFKDTVFVFVADHTAGAAGKVELDARKYHIPVIFYAPGFVKPQKYTDIASQIDTAPTLLGLLNFSYYTKFYGEDLLHDTDETPHAFISNYQKVALVKDNKITILAPRREVKQFDWVTNASITPLDERLKDDTIAYYQSASWWQEKQRRLPTTVVK